MKFVKHSILYQKVSGHICLSPREGSYESPKIGIFEILLCTKRLFCPPYEKMGNHTDDREFDLQVKTCQIQYGRSERELHSRKVHKSAKLVRLLEVPSQLTVFLVLQIEKCKILLYLLYPLIIKLNTLLGRPTVQCKFYHLHY